MLKDGIRKPSCFQEAEQTTLELSFGTLPALRMLVEQVVENARLSAPWAAVRPELRDESAAGEESTAEHVLEDAVEGAAWNH